jgi:outer membrane biosynthesis protein TonB
MRKALTISAVSHAVLLLWGVVTFAAKPHTPQSVESVAVDIISDKQFSQLTAGSKNAPNVEAAKPLVETVGERRPVDDPTGKIGTKTIADTTDKPPPTPKPPTPAEKKPPDSKPPEPKRDFIAEAIKKDQAKKSEPKKAEAKAQPKQETLPKKDLPSFDPKRIQQALLDKREPQRVAATGDAISPTAPLGGANGHAAVLSQSEIDALRDRLASLWTPPAGAGNLDELTVRVRFQLTKEGRLAGPPLLTSPFGHGSSVLFMASRDSALRAVLRAQPFTMLKPENYEQWKDLEINFDPRDMIRG